MQLGDLLLTGLIAPEDIRVVFEAKRFLLFLIPAMVLLPVQVLAEEVVFRGYLIQAMARIAHSNVVRGTIPALLFVLVHLQNEEISHGGAGALLIYLVLGLYLSVLAIRGNGLETAIGFHLGVNLHALLIVTTDVATLETPAILRTTDPDFLLYLPVLIVICTLHYWLVFRENPFRLMWPRRAMEETL